MVPSFVLDWISICKWNVMQFTITCHF